MLKLLLILSLIIFIAIRIGGFLFRLAGGTTTHTSYQKSASQNPAGGNVKVDYNPSKGDNKRDFKGGEYIDYEEVK
ncbi:MAG TPA: DUF4834 domain-containing protein [Cyclobacteriaceae bacterium]|nr:DUF4834 domain-containing protein [Cyclobacteriaceae bacterium]